MEGTYAKKLSIRTEKNSSVTQRQEEILRSATQEIEGSAEMDSGVSDESY